MLWNMMTSEYSRRVIELFKSGEATKAQEAEMIEAVLSASERGLENVTAIHKAIGFTAEQTEFAEQFASAGAA